MVWSTDVSVATLAELALLLSLPLDNFLPLDDETEFEGTPNAKILHNDVQSSAVYNRDQHMKYPIYEKK